MAAQHLDVDAPDQVRSTTDDHELEPPNNGNIGWSANEPYTTAFVVKSRSGPAAMRHIFRSGRAQRREHGERHHVPYPADHGAPYFFGLYLDGNLVASSTAANTATSIAWSIFRFGWGFSTNQDFNGDIALILCCGACWTGHMVRRWHADPFGFLRPWNEVPALMGSAPPATPPSTGTGVITFLMG